MGSVFDHATHTFELDFGHEKQTFYSATVIYAVHKEPVGITNELSNRISYYVCTFDDVSYVVCCVVVATPPVHVPLTQEHQNDESAPCHV